MRRVLISSIWGALFLVIATSLFQHPTGGKRRLALDLTSESKVVLITYDDNNLDITTILTDVEFFRGTPTGKFIARKKDGTWLIGNYTDPKKTCRIDACLVPENSIEATVDNAGNRIIWVTRDNRFKLLLTNLNSKKTSQIRSNTGVLYCPSWSPDDRKITFYSGLSLYADRYTMSSLELMEIPAEIGTHTNNVEWLVKEIAPHSFQHEYSGSRMIDPQWSPDGQWILFSACYSYQDNITQYYVKIDGTGLFPTSGMGPHGWSSDSKGIYSLLTQDHLHFKPTLVDIKTHIENDNSFIKKMPFQMILSWEPRGDYFIMQGDTVNLLNMHTGQYRELCDADDSYLVYWEK